MDEFSEDDIPCSSIAVDSFLRFGLAGSTWGLLSSPYEASEKGLTGIARASFVVKSIGKYGTYGGALAGMFSVTRCGIRRYRKQQDWVNACIAGAVTGAALAARTRSYPQILGTAAFLSVIGTLVDSPTSP